MMKNKKFWALLLALTMAFSLAACGGKDGSDGKSQDSGAPAAAPEEQKTGDAGEDQIPPIKAETPDPQRPLLKTRPPAAPETSKRTLTAIWPMSRARAPL